MAWGGNACEAIDLAMGLPSGAGLCTFQYAVGIRDGGKPIGLSRHSGLLKKFNEGKFAAEFALERRMQLGEKQRMPAEVEEIVVQADTFKSKQIAPNTRRLDVAQAS